MKVPVTASLPLTRRRTVQWHQPAPRAVPVQVGGERGGQLASQGKFPESEGFRTTLGSLWSALLIGSVLGLFYPVTMSPLLLIQVIYKHSGCWCSFCHDSSVAGGRKFRGVLC